MTNNQETVIFYGTLNSLGLLDTFNKFIYIKFRKNVYSGEKIIKGKNGKLIKKKINNDNAGGSFKRSEIPAIAVELGIKEDTLQRLINKMTANGWLKPTYTAYRITSLNTLYAKYTPNLGIKKITFRCLNKLELMRLCILYYLKPCLQQQMYREGNRRVPARLTKYCKALLQNSKYSISVRKLQKILGYKSPASTCQRMLELEKKGLLIIERRHEYLCEIKDLSFLLKGNPEIVNRFVLINNKVYERKCNNIYFAA